MSAVPLTPEAAADRFGSAWGVLAALILIAGLLIAAFWVDRRIDPWVRRFGRSPLPLLRVVARRPVLARIALWLSVFVLALVLAAWLSGLVAWILVPAVVLSLALASSSPLRDIVLGVGSALSAHLKEGDYVAIAGLQGEITRVGLRSIELRTLDGTRVDVSHGRIAKEGLRRLTVEASGYPVDMVLPVPEDLDLAALIEGARLAASLAPHAHLGARPLVTLSESVPPVLRVRGYAIDPFCAGPYRGEVVMSFRETVAELRSEAADRVEPAAS